MEAYNYLKDRNEERVTTKSGENELCQHRCTKFFLIEPSQIDHKKTIPGTQKIHSVRRNADDPSTVLSRNLSCLCESCREEKYEHYINPSYVDVWIERDRFIKKESRKRSEQIKSTNQSTENPSRDSELGKNESTNLMDIEQEGPSIDLDIKEHLNARTNLTIIDMEMESPSRPREREEHMDDSTNIMDIDQERPSIDREEYFRNLLKDIRLCTTYNQL